MPVAAAAAPPPPTPLPSPVHCSRLCSCKPVAAHSNMTHPIHSWQINLTESCSSTLPFENGRQIRTIAVSPDGRLLLSIDDEGRALVVNRRRRALLHHFSFKGPVRAAKWSPDGRYLAAAVGRLLQVRGAAFGDAGAAVPLPCDVCRACCHCGCPCICSRVRSRVRSRCHTLPSYAVHLAGLCLQVWKSPGLEKSVAPMQLHRTFGQCHSDITTVDWSADSQWLVRAAAPAEQPAAPAEQPPQSHGRAGQCGAVCLHKVDGCGPSRCGPAALLACWPTAVCHVASRPLFTTLPLWANSVCRWWAARTCRRACSA